MPCSGQAQKKAAALHAAGDGIADAVTQSHGPPRSQVLLELAGIGSVLILAVNVLAVNGSLHPLYSVQKCP